MIILKLAAQSKGRFRRYDFVACDILTPCLQQHPYTHLCAAQKCRRILKLTNKKAKTVLCSVIKHARNAEDTRESFALICKEIGFNLKENKFYS